MVMTNIKKRAERIFGEREIENKFQGFLEDWQESPLRFVEEALQVEPTDQQKDALKALGNIVKAKEKVWMGAKCSKEEKELAAKIGISIMSGKGTGKDAFLAWAILWFMLHKMAKIPVSGPSYDQVRDILWGEISKWTTRRGEEGKHCFFFANDIAIKADKVYWKSEEENEEGKSTFARIRTAPLNASKEIQAKTLDGWHEDYLLIVVDEASAVPDSVFKAFDSTLTRPVNLVILAFNPSRNSGYAYDTHFGKTRHHWVLFQWDSRLSSLVSQEQIKLYEEKYGRDSPEFQINVCGLPPVDDEKAVIPYSRCEAALNRDIAVRDDDPIFLGVDPARLGEDRTGWIVRHGPVVLDMGEFCHTDAVACAQKVMEKMAEFEPDATYIEITGVGGPIYDFLIRNVPGKVFPVDVATAAVENRKYGLLRDELWMKLARRFKNGLISLPSEHPLVRKLMNELSCVRIKDDDRKGRIKIENKKDLRKRGIPSPNIADALMITEHASEEAYRAAVRAKRELDPYDEEDDETKEPESWMTA